MNKNSYVNKAKIITGKTLSPEATLFSTEVLKVATKLRNEGIVIDIDPFGEKIVPNVGGGIREAIGMVSVIYNETKLWMILPLAKNGRTDEWYSMGFFFYNPDTGTLPHISNKMWSNPAQDFWPIVEFLLRETSQLGLETYRFAVRQLKYLFAVDCEFPLEEEIIQTDIRNAVWKWTHESSNRNGEYNLIGVPYPDYIQEMNDTIEKYDGLICFIGKYIRLGYYDLVIQAIQDNWNKLGRLSALLDIQEFLTKEQLMLFNATFNLPSVLEDIEQQDNQGRRAHIRAKFMNS